MDEYYKILGINKSSSDKQINEAYKNLALKLHPDRGGNTYLFNKIKDAYLSINTNEKKQVLNKDIDNILINLKSYDLLKYKKSNNDIFIPDDLIIDNSKDG